MNQKKHILQMSILASPQMANFSGVVHGGELLKLLDQVAYACATRYCGVGVVTLSVNEVLFKRPIPIGSLMHFDAKIHYVGHTSCDVGIIVEYEEITTGNLKQCTYASFTMVALNREGQKVQIPPLIPQTQEEKINFEKAKKRRGI